jgi:hypothetical protein
MAWAQMSITKQKNAMLLPAKPEKFLHGITVYYISPEVDSRSLQYLDLYRKRRLKRKESFQRAILLTSNGMNYTTMVISGKA